MKVGDLVKIIAPESITGCIAGKIGIVSEIFIDPNSTNDCVVSIFDSTGFKEAYLRQNELKILSE
jgi:hypothetical protein